MRSTDAYSILSRELAAAALLPSNDLSQLADGPPFSRVIEISSEPVEIEIDVSWHGFGRTAVLISAHARFKHMASSALPREYGRGVAA